MIAPLTAATLIPNALETSVHVYPNLLFFNHRMDLNKSSLASSASILANASIFLER